MFEFEEGGDDAPVEQSEAPAAVEAPAPWDGSMDSLLTQPWVPEDARPHLERHLSAHRDAVVRRDFLNDVFAADDQTAALAKDLETTRAELASLREAMGKTEKERDDYRGKMTAYEEERDAAAREQQIIGWREKYPDIFTEKDETNESSWHRAWEQFYNLLAAGYPEDKAAKMARAYLPDDAPAPAAPAAAAPSPTPAAPARREVAVPKGVAAASKGSASPAVTVNAAEANEGFEARVARMVREEEARLRMEGR